jgi:hypothetical protein
MRTLSAMPQRESWVMVLERLANRGSSSAASTTTAPATTASQAIVGAAGEQTDAEADLDQTQGGGVGEAEHVSEAV